MPTNTEPGFAVEGRPPPVCYDAPVAAVAELGAGDQPGGPEAACTGTPGAAAGMPGGAGEATGSAALADLGIGSVVLATAGHAEGWFESLVLKVDDKCVMTLKWHDFRNDPQFARRRHKLALMHPGCKPG